MPVLYPNPCYSKTRVKRPLSKRPKIGFQDQLSLNAGKKYCRMLQGEHSEILSTLMKKVNKQCLLDTPRTVKVSEKTWQVIV